MTNRRSAQPPPGVPTPSANPVTDALVSRARQGQLTFAAVTYASRSGCTCDACQYLRRAADALLEETRQEVALDAGGLNISA